MFKPKSFNLYVGISVLLLAGVLVAQSAESKEPEKFMRCIIHVNESDNIKTYYLSETMVEDEEVKQHFYKKFKKHADATNSGMDCGQGIQVDTKIGQRWINYLGQSITAKAVEELEPNWKVGLSRPPIVKAQAASNPNDPVTKQAPMPATIEVKSADGAPVKTGVQPAAKPAPKPVAKAEPVPKPAAKPAPRKPTRPCGRKGQRKCDRPSAMLQKALPQLV